MSMALDAHPPPAADTPVALEVEEAELSSDADQPRSPRKPSKRLALDDDDFVIDDVDDDPISDSANSSEEPYRRRDAGDQPQSPSPNASPSRDLDPDGIVDRNASPRRRSRPSSALNNNGSKRSPNISSRSSDADNESSAAGSASSPDGNDDDRDHLPDFKEEDSDDIASEELAEGRDASVDDPHVNGSGGGGGGVVSDSDDHSDVVMRKGTRRRERKLVIPRDMLDDGQYFRRSRRARRSPQRLSDSPERSSSSIGSDLDFNADDGHPEDEEEEDVDVDDLDDEDFSVARKRTSRGHSRRNGTSRRRETAKGQEPEEDILDEIPSGESDSDGDWRDGTKEKGVGRRHRKKRRSHPVAKRQRSEAFPEDDEVTRTARINSRTGDAVNYFESDDDFLESDEQLQPPGGLDEVVDDSVPHVDAVLQYRPIDDEKVTKKGDLPFANFRRDEVEFHIKWMNKSYRSSTWENWLTLRDMKGNKRVRNYIKIVEERRAAFRNRTDLSAEEIEEVAIAMEEHRATLKTFEVIDRVIAQRDCSDGSGQTEYLVKWKNLPYSECTWEPSAELSSDADLKAIDDYNDREQSVLNNTRRKRFNPFNAKDERPRFKRMLEQPDYLHGDGRTLRDYQLAGLNFLAFSWTKRNNVILADEMGLGKTLQTISFLGWLMYCRHVAGPFLVVVPLSTIAAWVREFARWLPDMNVVCYSGDGKSRGIIRKHEFWSTTKGSSEKFHVLLTTPELLMQDLSELNQIRWAMIAVDEAHRLKNETSSLHLDLASLRSANRLLVTGTPLQNSVRELWALLHFLNPDIFSDADAFEESFSFAALRDPERVSSLHKTLRPYIIRRQKTDVEKSLPKKTYAVLRVGMTSGQQQFYRWLLTKNFAKLNAGSKGRGMGTTATLRNLVMELKKCCNHPYLFPHFEDTSTPTSCKELVRASGKMMLLDKLLIRLREKGHRVLIFSQMVRMLDILQDYCRMRQFPSQRLDGSISNELRQRAVDHFNAPDSNDYIFLLSTRAGGLGINLATADTVIIFDSDWNPQNDLQAESRAHRIGQKKDVKVFRLLSRETVEEDILERAKRKRVLEHLVIHGVEGGDQADGKDAQAAFKKEELSAILRFGAEKLFEKDRVSAIADGAARSDARTSEGDVGAASAKPPSTHDVADQEKDEKAEERRVLEVDDIDELLARAPTDEASQVGGAQPSVGDSLLNAFKWADFKTVEEEDEVDDDRDDNNEMAKNAAKKLVAIDAEASKAQQHEKREMEEVAKEGDAEFWDRVIPGQLKDQALADEMVLGSRRRKRTKAYQGDSPRDGKRRRTTRGGRLVTDRISDADELSAKEQRSLLRSLRKFGDPAMVKTVITDAGLQDRVDDELVISMLVDCLDRAKAAVEDAKNTNSLRKSQEEPDPEYESQDEGRKVGKDSKTKSTRVPFDVLGEKGVDATDLLKRCEDLQMLRKHIQTFQPDTQFRLRRVLKAPSYNVRWKPQNDAMLLVGVYRHGFGNWTQIALDKQLVLADKMNVAGNPDCKPGAPDTTKLTRRVTALLRELENEVRATNGVKKSRPREKKDGRAVDGKKVPKGPQKKILKTRKRDGAAPKGDGSASIPAGKVKKAPTRPEFEDLRFALKTSHLSTLKELRALSKENGQLDNNEKIRKTKQCLLKLGRAIDDLTEQSARAQKDLWRYVHEVCRTSLAGARLQAIYEKLAAVGDMAEENDPSHS